MSSKVTLVKISTLAGHTVKIAGGNDDYVGKAPFYFRVDRVENASNPRNVGRVWWLYGKRVRADGRIAIRQAHSAQFVTPRDILSVR